MVPDYLTIAEGAQLIASKELSPVELVEGCPDAVLGVVSRVGAARPEEVVPAFGLRTVVFDE